MTTQPVSDQQDTLGGDAEFVLAAIAAEIIHEVTHTRNYLRFSTSQSGSPNPDEDTTRFAQTELERLQRLLGHLRRLKLPPPRNAPALLRTVLDESIRRAQLAMAGQHLQLAITGEADVPIQTDPAILARALQHLLLHAAVHAPKGDPIAVQVEQRIDRPTTIQISDRGSTLLHPEPSALFTVWSLWPLSEPASHRALAYRLLRHLGWSLDYERRDDQNIFLCTSPPEFLHRS